MYIYIKIQKYRQMQTKLKTTKLKTKKLLIFMKLKDI